MKLTQFLKEVAGEAPSLAGKDAVARIEIHFVDGPVMMFAITDNGRVIYVPDFLHRAVRQGKEVVTPFGKMKGKAA
jgi:hypothetical protein